MTAPEGQVQRRCDEGPSAPINIPELSSAAEGPSDCAEGTATGLLVTATHDDLAALYLLRTGI